MKKVNVKIKPIGLFDLLAFKNIVPNRVKRFQAASDSDVAEQNINKLAKRLHPQKQEMVIKEIIERGKGVKTFRLKRKDGENPAYFRAGQYISLRLSLDGSVFTRPYSLSSSPKDALNGFYDITIKANEDGFYSKWAVENLKKGDQIECSAPEGTFYYEKLRDCGAVVGICGGSGITPFISMAKAIAEGDEDFNLILLYGSCKECDILFKDELAKLEKKSGGKVKTVHVLSEEENKAYEQGFITSKIIKKYAPADQPYSVFMCGPQAMYDFVDKELNRLKIERRLIRRELFGEIKNVQSAKGYPKDAKKEYKIKVKTLDGIKEIKAKSNESVLVAIERAGIAAPSKCRSGECGYCRSKLLEGDVFITKDNDGRRAADKKFGFIHPCSSYPLSDLFVEIPEA